MFLEQVGAFAQETGTSAYFVVAFFCVIRFVPLSILLSEVAQAVFPL